MRSRRQRGAVAIIIAVTIPAIVAIGAGLILIGRITTTRQRLQYAADALAADGALMAKRQGFASVSQPNYKGVYGWIPTQNVALQTMVDSRNGNLPMAPNPPLPTWVMAAPPAQPAPPELPSPPAGSISDFVYSSVGLTTNYSGVQLNATAQWKIPQIRTNNPRRRPPGVVLVLDYSNSMNKQGDGGSAVQILRNAVQTFTSGLTPGYVNLGLVIYGSNVYATVVPELSTVSNFADILNQVAANASGDTDTADGINAATTMLTGLKENFGRNIVLISDGEPCCSGSATNDAIAAAANAKAQGIQILTLSVHHAGTTGNPDATLEQIATPGFAQVVSPASIQIILDALDVQPLCDVTPGGDPFDSWAFLRSEGSGVEQPLLRYDTVADMCPPNAQSACLTYGYVSQTNPYPLVVFSSQACNDIFQQGKEGVVRWGRPALSR